MKVSELKRIIQPMIKECIREVLLEEGMLSRIVKETAEGLSGAQLIKEQQKSSVEGSQRKLPKGSVEFKF